MGEYIRCSPFFLLLVVLFSLLLFDFYMFLIAGTPLAIALIANTIT